MEDRESLEQIRRRKTSIDALDLQIDLKNVNPNQAKRKVSQIDNLRHKFHEYHHSAGLHRKASSTSSSEGSVEGPKKRKVSQIDVFRSKFLAYYGGKTEGPGALDTLSENVKTKENDSRNISRKATPPLQTPSSEHSEGEELPRFSSSPPAFLCDNNNNKDNASQKNVESEHRDKDSVRKKSQSSRLSLASVLQHSKLITVTLNKKPGEGWGIELVHVTKTGSSMGQDENGAKEEGKVVYVQHNGNGQNSIMSTSGDISNELLTPSSGTSTPLSASSSGSSEQEIAAILAPTSRSSADFDKPSNDMRHIVHKQNLRRKMGSITNIHQLAPEGSPISSRPSSASHLRPINPLPPRPSSALAQWRKEGSPQHRPGVRIVALTEGGVAEKSNELAVDDLIVEVKKIFSNYSIISSPHARIGRKQLTMQELCFTLC